MRDILFRGKQVSNGEWISGAYFCLCHDDERTHGHHFIIPGNIPIPKERTIGEIQVEVSADTVGQFTGLIDKNGSLIFEGDIVSHEVFGKKQVVYGNVKEECLSDCLGFMYDGTLAFLNKGDSRQVEAIGTIFDKEST